MLGLTLADILVRLVVVVVAFTVHEFAHAATADYFGDDTPRSQGRLTLNPLAHLDFVGSLMLVVAGFGWAKPVMVNYYALESRSRAAPMLVAFAGPFSNFLLAALAAIPLRFGLITVSPSASTIIPSLSDFLLTFIFLNLVLLVFNLLPVFPLDGEKVLMYFLPPAGERFFLELRRYSFLPLLLLVLVLPRLGLDILGLIIIPAVRFLFEVLVA